jgi:hypothetical protein
VDPTRSGSGSTTLAEPSVRLSFKKVTAICTVGLPFFQRDCWKVLKSIVIFTVDLSFFQRYCWKVYKVLSSAQVTSLFFRETVEKLKKIRDDRRTGTGDIQQGEISSSEGVLPKEILGEYCTSRNRFQYLAHTVPVPTVILFSVVTCEAFPDPDLYTFTDSTRRGRQLIG